MSESVPPSGPVRVQSCAAHPSSDDVALACMTADRLTSALAPTMLPSLTMTAPTHATEVEHIMTNPGPEHPPTVKEPAGDHAMPTRDHAASQASTGGAYAATAYHTTPRHDLDLLAGEPLLRAQNPPPTIPVDSLSQPLLPAAEERETLAARSEKRDVGSPLGRGRGKAEAWSNLEPGCDDIAPSGAPPGAGRPLSSCFDEILAGEPLLRAQNPPPAMFEEFFDESSLEVYHEGTMNPPSLNPPNKDDENTPHSSHPETCLNQGGYTADLYTADLSFLNEIMSRNNDNKYEG